MSLRKATLQQMDWGESMMLLLRQQALLVLVAGLVFFTNLGRYALFNNDESTYAGSAAEMFRHSAWIVPTFNDEQQTNRPILVYWSMLASYLFFGISDFSARFASSLLAVGTTLLTYHLGRKLYSSKVGLLAGMILCTCLLFSAYGRAATPDSTVVFFMTLVFASYVWVVSWQRGGNFNGFEISNPKIPESVAEESSVEIENQASAKIRPTLKQIAPRTWQLAVPMFIAMGLAVLAIGPSGALLPYLAIVLFLLITLRIEDIDNERLKAPEGPRWRRWPITVVQVLRPRQVLEACRSTHLMVGIGITIAIAVPWYLSVSAITGGTWLREFLWTQNIEQVFGVEGNHRGFPFYPFYHLVTVHFGCFPWSVFLPVAIYQLWQRLTDDDATWKDSDRLLACWAGVWFVFYSLVTIKLPNLILPVYPALALILARFFYDWEWEEGDSGVYSFNLCCKALGIAGAILVVGLYIAAFLYFPDGQWLALTGAVPMIGAFCAIKFLDHDQRQRVMQTLVVIAVVVALLTVGIGPSWLSPYQDSPIFVAEARRIAKSNDVEIATFDYVEPSFVFYVGKRVRKLSSAREVADFLASRPRSFVVTKAMKHNELREELRDDVTELSRHRNFLGREELILLGRN